MFESVRYLSINSHAIQLGETYASVPPGSAVAYVGSHGFIEIGVNLGRADTLLHAPIGTPVNVELS
jgi:S-adenosylmethionine hydrolase